MTENDQTANSNQAPTATTAASLGLKDLLVPVSIMIAGAFVGIGLFLGGSGGGTALVAAPTENQPAAAEAPADSTDRVLAINETDWIKGNPDAPIKIIEYSDFDCPFCSRFHFTMDEIVAESDGQVAWVYRHFPLEQLHPQAGAVALAAECVGAAGGEAAFWQFTDRYFEVRGARDATPHSVLIPQLVTEAGVGEAEFTACFESGEYGDKIQSHMDNAIATGGRGTPWSILIGPDGETYPLNGAQPKAAVEQLINLALEEA